MVVFTNEFGNQIMKRALQNFVSQLVPVIREINHYKRVTSNTIKN